MPIKKIDISTSTIFRFILIILGLVLLYLTRDILLVLFFAVIVAAGVEGPVSWLQKKGIKRIFGVAIVYALTIIFLAGIVYLIIPPLAVQLKTLVFNLPGILNEIGLGWDFLSQKVHDLKEGGFLSLPSGFGSTISNVFQTTFSFFGGVFSLLVVFVISLYLSAQEKGIKNFMIVVTPRDHRDYISSLASRIEGKLGAWVRGQLLLMFSVAVLVFVALSLLKIKYALVLALLAGLLEIIPYIGPIVAAIPAIILAFLQAPWLGGVTALLYYAIQQLENYVLAPQIMKKALGLNPVIIILALLVGAKLAGVLGMIAAVPIAAIVNVFLSDFFKDKEE